ncbi:nucleotide exchange factor GrpE [Nocardioides okcheonensis]|uniref:nucleotide exchange factor GrpE n=1 Tax=Nocardioides okcheonensis TaxID=2894081 RepID=UPI001E2CAF19|nr:nucleotide exchange factor GrpE [Nocardioides okcheonensis]UFN42660.1 nucleotide exchange factor GrpE [Nocardioides okcheonensis]
MTSPGSESFGDAAGEMANETEVEAPVEGASAPAGQPDADATPDDHAEEISGVDNWLEEGGPLEPQDVAETEQVAASAEVQLAERTADLQRLQAEYANYRKRVDRDRQVVAENATFRVLAPIIEVLDTIDRAREHGEVEGGFKAVADQLEGVVANLGLTRFGTPGDAFDPNLHEALSHLGTDADVTVPTCKHIAKAGYKIGDRVVRAAQVLVVDPADA